MITVPKDLFDFLVKEFGADWAAGLPGLAERMLDRWGLRLAGEPMNGMVSLVLPVVRADGTRAALKLQPVDEETESEPVGLRVWDGNGIVRLLDHDEETGAMLLEWLDSQRPLSTHPDHMVATGILAELLARLVAVPSPGGIRHLKDIAQAMVDETPQAVKALADKEQRQLLSTCAAAVAEVLNEPGDQLLHWDLHYDNILAAEREPWLAIDPKPLAGDPGFDIMPALDNRWDDIVATGDVSKAVLKRFDLMTEVLGLDRKRAARWTLARVLQNSLWDIADGEPGLQQMQMAIAAALLTSPQHLL